MPKNRDVTMQQLKQQQSIRLWMGGEEQASLAKYHVT
jgi:hypothetical protein